MLYNNDGVNRGTEQVAHSGLAQIYAGQDAADFFGVPYSDPRYPDVFGRVQVGVVYTTGTKIAEHGGDNMGDQDVPLVVFAPRMVPPSLNSSSVETTQVAPTILQLLGLDPNALGGRTSGGHAGPARHRLASPLLPGVPPGVGGAPGPGSRRHVRGQRRWPRLDVGQALRRADRKVMLHLARDVWHRAVVAAALEHDAPVSGGSAFEHVHTVERPAQTGLRERGRTSP